MPIIRRLKAEGYRVIVLTQFDGFENSIKSEVDEIRPLFISRQGINPLIDFTFLDFYKTFDIFAAKLYFLIYH